MDSRKANARLFQCFCGCSELTLAQIKQIAMMNVLTLIKDPLGKKVFQNYLRIGHRTDKSRAMEILECFELCDIFLENMDLAMDDAKVNDLLELCTLTWEMKIKKAIKIGKHKYPNENLHRVLGNLKEDCVCDIECQLDYRCFREKLLSKIAK